MFVEKAFVISDTVRMIIYICLNQRYIRLGKPIHLSISLHYSGAAAFIAPQRGCCLFVCLLLYGNRILHLPTHGASR